jgi:transposase-like protein
MANGVQCPRCNFSRAYHYLENNVPKHRCKRCNYKFSDITGTIFQRTKIPLSKWILAIALFKIGISANQLAKEIGVAYRIAWNLMHKFHSTIEKRSIICQTSRHNRDG